MRKWRVLAALILVIGVLGCLYMLIGVAMVGWLHTATLDGHRQSHLERQLWFWLIGAPVWLFGSWVLAWWVWKVGSRAKSNQETDERTVHTVLQEPTSDAE